MFCPDTVIYCGSWLYIGRYDGADYTRDVPLKIRFNPLRYYFTIFPRRRFAIRINEKAIWNRRWSNFNWWLWKKKATEKRHAREWPEDLPREL